MKKFKNLVIGFVAGAMCMSGISAYAEYSSVSASVFDDVTFVFDGERTASPSDLPVLNYNNYTYVPLRYVAETLGAKVEWKIPTRTIDIISDKKTYVKEVEVEKIVYVEKGEVDNDTAVYSKLPLKAKDNRQIVEVLGVSRDEGAHYTKIFISVENKGQFGIQVIPSSGKLTVDGVEVKTFAMPRYWDDSWETSYIENDEEREGYLCFDLIDEDYEKIALEFQVRDLEDEITTYNFYFKK